MASRRIPLKKPKAAECNDPIYDKEMLAIISALRTWRQELVYVEEPFEIWTDHKNLEFFMTTRELNELQVRYYETIL